MQKLEPRKSKNYSSTPDRRQFVRYLLGFSVVSTIAGVLTPIAGYLWPSLRRSQSGSGNVLIGSLLDIPSGLGKVVPVDNRPVVVVHGKDGQVRAFGAVCTHLGCVVEWDDARQFILCPCHDARFNQQTGAVISGPAPAPLPVLKVNLEGNDIYVEVSNAA